MSFVVYDLILLVLFTLAVALFLYTRKKNLKREGITFLYRTKLGIKFIDYVAKRYSKLIGFMRYVIVVFGYAAMAAMLYLLWITLKMFFTRPDMIQIIIRSLFQTSHTR